MTAAADIANAVFGSLGGCDQESKYVAVTGRDDVRWLLPVGGTSLTNLLASWRPYRITSRVGWLVLRAASRVGCMAALPAAHVVGNLPTDLRHWQGLGWRWSGVPIAAIHVGTPGPRRKAVAHLLERESGCCRAVVKIPLTAEAKVAILREAEVLRQLESDGCTFAPQLLCVDRDKGIATQKFVEGRPAGRRFTPAIYKLLGSLLRPGGATSLATHAMPLAADLDAVDGKSTVRGALEDLHDETPLPSCWEHGDFAPWNIRRTVDGDCVLLDWEDARRDGLPLMDAFHFLHMQDFLFGSKPRLHAASIRELAATMHVPLRSTAKLEAAYLLRAWTQSVREGNSARAGYVQRALAMSGRKAA